MKMTRPEKPVDPGSPLADFAASLRKLRQKRGITYREMAGIANFSYSSLAVAAAGRKLPTWEVTRAYVTACGGCVDEWRARWDQARQALRRPDGRACV
jgi:hypothetical protein